MDKETAMDFRAKYSKPQGPVRKCENPLCGATLPAHWQNNKKLAEQRHCDRKCLDEHHAIQARERRPKELFCTACGSPIDAMKRKIVSTQGKGPFFCDPICSDKYRRETGFYDEMSVKGKAATQEYQQKHGKMYNEEARAKKTSENNKKAPTRAKYFTRVGKIWGYEARGLPDEDNDGYRLIIVEYPQLGIVRAKTFKGCILLMRQRIVDARSNPLPTDEDSPLSALSEKEFEDFYNVFMAGRDYSLLDGYQRVAGHYNDSAQFSHALDVELVKRYASSVSSEQKG
jgi:hypothetical protein